MVSLCLHINQYDVCAQTFEFIFFNSTGAPLYDCEEILESGYTKSGLYKITAGGDTDFTVFCDMNLLGGGWTVIQRRVSGSVAFDRKWRLYQNGFGDFTSNFWLGLNKIKRITDMKTYELYVGLEDIYGGTAWALYGSFSLGSEANHYKLQLSDYYADSTAGDSLSDHSGQSFSTVDRDNDLSASVHCSETYRGAGGTRTAMILTSMECGTTKLPMERTVSFGTAGDRKPHS